MTKWFAPFARSELIADASLREAIARAERGLIDADLGGGLIKQRVARPGKGRSGVRVRRNTQLELFPALLVLTA